ncbi:MAG: dihydroorotase [Candidatus Omnitrophota bacterium]
MKLLIKNGHIVDPANKIDETQDILIKDAKISKVAKNIKEKADKIIDATDKILMPGLVDMHVHLREPGRKDKETVASGTKAALKGGITSVVAMPNTQPPMDSADNIKLLKTIIKKTAEANVFIAGTITFGRLGKESTDVGSLRKEGAIVITDDGSSVDDENLLFQALKDTKKEKILLISHCEDKSLSNNGVVNLGFISTILGLRSVPKESEYKIVERDIKLADKVGASIHIAHVSCKESVDIIAKAKKRGVKVTAETAPHYFALDEESLLTYDTNLKINPPLRTKEDLKAIKQGLKSGIIDCIASDHAPHTRPEKEVSFEEAAFGTIGLETALAVAITELLDTSILTWTQLVERMSLSPATILGIDKGTLSVGKDADIVIVNPNKEWTVTQDCFESKSKNSAFIGKKLKGAVAYTICAGKIAYKSK